MSTSISSQDILDDIEFELAQGAISRDDLGRGILAVKQYQSKLRTELLQPDQEEPALRAALGRQFQLNDMVLTLLQETAAAVRDFRLQLQRDRQLSSPPRDQRAASSEPSDVGVTLTEDQWRDTTPLRDAGKTSLEPELDLRPTSLPIIGFVLQRLRHAFHTLVLFYLRKLGDKQKKINNTYSEWLLYQDSLHRYHEEENVRLRRQVIELEKRLARLESNKPE